MKQLTFRNRSIWVVVSAVLAHLVGSASQARADLVVNGGFETGNLTGWTTTGNMGPQGVTTVPDFVHSGNFGFDYGQIGSLGFLSQTIPTVAGQSYTFAFFQKTLAGTPNEFQAYWNGVQILDLLNSPIATNWTGYSFTETATGSSTVISFGLRQDPGFSALDDVSVVPRTTAIPEPSTMASAGIAILMGLGYPWRRRKA